MTLELPSPSRPGTATSTPVRNVQALGHQLLDAAVDVGLVQLEVGNAVAQQATDLVVLLEHGHVVAGARQLLGRRQTRRAGADHGHLLAALGLGQAGA